MAGTCKELILNSKRKAEKPGLYQLLESKRTNWNDVLNRIRRFPEEVEAKQDANFRGLYRPVFRTHTYSFNDYHKDDPLLHDMLDLDSSMRARVPFSDIVQALVHAHPDAVRVRQRADGMLPLHLISSQRYPGWVQDWFCIFELFQGAACFSDSFGRLPINVLLGDGGMLFSFPCQDIERMLKALIRANPDSLVVPYKNRQTLWEQVSCQWGMWKDRRRGSTSDEGLSVLALVLNESSRRCKLKPKSDFHPTLHSLALEKHWRGSEFSLVDLVGAFRPDLLDRDEDGNLPIHVLLSGKTISNSDARKRATLMLEAFLQANPCAASYGSADGELPLHMSIRRGFTWQSGVHSVLRACPSSLMVTGHDSLYPFMMAAAMPDGDLSTIFALLREAPHLLMGMSTGL